MIFLRSIPPATAPAGVPRLPTLISDAVDAYVIRRLNARLQFLLLQRRADAPFGSSWQAIHARVAPEETAIIAAERALAETTGSCCRHRL